MIDGRECFNPMMVPITEFSKGLSWPPTYIKCDCNEILRRSQRGNGSYYWKCPSCKKLFTMTMGRIILEKTN